MKEEVLLSFDPGLREAGFAVFIEGRLFDCGAVYARTDLKAKGVRQWLDMLRTMVRILNQYKPDRFVWEGMSTRKGREDAHASLFDLTIISGMIAGWAAKDGVDLDCIPANRWTHGRKKKVNQGIMRKKCLDRDEISILDEVLAKTAESNKKEVYDAVGIGLYDLKRFL